MSSYPSREYKLLSKIDKSCSKSINQWFIKTIGDDCAVRIAGSNTLLFSADTLVEDVHFRRDFMSLQEIGYKAAMVNISDIAAMGGTPDSLLIQLVFPQGTPESDVEALYEGLGLAVSEFNCPIVGGDLSKGPCWMIAVTITGRASERILYRDGAQVGDLVWVSGTPGLSALGLEKLFDGEKSRENCAIIKHVKPIPRIELGKILAKDSAVTSMLDISDGVAKEALTVAKESEVGMELFLPVDIKKVLNSEVPKSNPVEYFLNGGEDYELFFTASKEFVPPKGFELHKIGIVTEGHQLYFSDGGSKSEITAGGWDHV